MLISAEKDNNVNTMTASWGGVGVMWGKNVAYIVIGASTTQKNLLTAFRFFFLKLLRF